MMPKVEGGELAMTSNEISFLDERPERIIVVGGCVCWHVISILRAGSSCTLHSHLRALKDSGRVQQQGVPEWRPCPAVNTRMTD